MLELTKSKNIISYDQFKKTAASNMPLSRTVALSALVFMTGNQVMVDGLVFTLAPQAVTDLCKLLGLPVTFDRLISNNLGADAKLKVAELTKTANIVKGKAPNITIVVGKSSTNIIQRILKTYSLVQPSAYFSLFERLTDSGDFTVQDIVNTEDGGCSISVRAKGGEFQVGNFKDEMFDSGFTLINSPAKGTVFSSYLLRQVCANGMIANREHEISLSNLGAEKFFKELNEVKERNFMPINFSNNVERAIKTYASYGELKQLANLITTASNCEKSDVDKYVPINQIRRAFMAKGLDPAGWNKDQEKNAISNVKLWDAINGVTWFASHNEGYNISDANRRDLQMRAGTILTRKSYDTENQIKVSLV